MVKESISELRKINMWFKYLGVGIATSIFLKNNISFCESDPNDIAANIILTFLIGAGLSFIYYYWTKEPTPIDDNSSYIFEYLGEYYHTDSVGTLAFLIRAIGEFYCFMYENNYVFSKLPINDFKNYDKLIRIIDWYLAKKPVVTITIDNEVITYTKNSLSKNEIIRWARLYADKKYYEHSELIITR